MVEDLPRGAFTESSSEDLEKEPSTVDLGKSYEIIFKNNGDVKQQTQVLPYFSENTKAKIQKFTK